MEPESVTWPVTQGEMSHGHSHKVTFPPLGEQFFSLSEPITWQLLLMMLTSSAHRRSLDMQG